MKITFGHIQFLQYLGVERKLIYKNLTKTCTAKHTMQKEIFLAEAHLKLPILDNNVCYY
jgi:hypothetical protein